ncbi:HD domain-containing protein [Myxococcota bacterium]|nr:HD domain-containing protein [Myxococcota bacterium]MBU1535191.1 HD domain-containing protein [Myxococcota bacterium]
MSTLEKAIGLAATVHAGQTDKAGVPYILHPLRVMLNQTTNETRITAVLHDVVEDSDMTIGDLRHMGFSQNILDAIEAVTKRSGEPYEDFIKRSAKNPIAKLVKKADLLDNIDISRIASPTQADTERIAKYEMALKYLE